jgi:long-chain acyl-CoA synthetase
MKNKVLITGANGFLGTQITLQLISKSELEILAMVRAKDHEHALKRLKRAWWDWPELIEALKSQIKVLPGDITHENLKISDKDYKSLASSLTHIIHTVADLRLHAPLEELRLTNLQGTCNLIKLAQFAAKEGKFKRFSHVSTAYVAGKRQGIILEDELSYWNDETDFDTSNSDVPNSDRPSFWSNYEESKYEAEKAVREFDLPPHIQNRMILAISQTGEIKTLTPFIPSKTLS